MPVIDHPVHEHGMRDAEHRYSCHNRAPFRETVTNRYTSWPFRMSRECRYDRSLSDGACAGCIYAGSGERYVAEQEAAKAR